MPLGSPDAEGDALGPYRIVAKLGAGGMGEAYRARDTRLGRDVAIKVLPAHVAEDPGRVQRFRTEARAALLERTGAGEQAATLVREVERRGPRFDPIGPAIFYLLRGDLDATADWTARAIEERHSAVFFYLAEHASALRASPRCEALARMLNLPMVERGDTIANR